MASIYISATDQSQAKQWLNVLAAEHDIALFTNLEQAHHHILHSPPALLIVAEETINPNLSSLSAETPKTVKIMVIGHNWPDDRQIQAMISGCSGYCDSTDAQKVLLKAVQLILEGEIWIQRHLVPQVIKILSQNNSNQQSISTDNLDINGKLESLSKREQEVANLVKTGNSNKIIAAELNIAERTVKAHLTSIFNKLDVSDRLHLAILLKENPLSD